MQIKTTLTFRVRIKTVIPCSNTTVIIHLCCYYQIYYISVCYRLDSTVIYINTIANTVIFLFTYIITFIDTLWDVCVYACGFNFYLFSINIISISQLVFSIL